MSKSFKIIINAGSGHDEKEKALSVITETLTGAGHQFEIIKITKSDDIIAKSRTAVLKAKADNSIMVVAGGDGSINAVAGLCHEHDVPMGVIPMGTFNFFARDHNIPVDIGEACHVLINGDLQPVPIGMINDQIFLVHAGIGLYSEIMRNRERDKRQYGRYRIVAFISSFRSLMSIRKTQTVTIKTDEETITRRTLNIFVGNNTLQLEKLGLTAPGEVKKNELAIILLKSMRPAQRLRLAFLALVRQMNLEERIERFITQEFTVETKEKRISAAIDGERMTFSTPLHFKSIPDGLRLIVPKQEQSE